MLPGVAHEQCYQAALKALELDETLPQAHAMIATLRANEFDWKGSERDFSRALHIDPEALDVRFLYNYFYLAPMRLDKLSGRKSIELDPLSPMKQVISAFISHMRRTAPSSSTVMQLSLIRILCCSFKSRISYAYMRSTCHSAIETSTSRDAAHLP
jgi:hypothetical protein